jgi:hypothetical protein
VNDPQHDHDDEMRQLCVRLLGVLDENAELRGLVIDMAARLPLTDDQRILLRAVHEGRWRR